MRRPIGHDALIGVMGKAQELFGYLEDVLLLVISGNDTKVTKNPGALFQFYSKLGL